MDFKLTGRCSIFYVFGVHFSTLSVFNFLRFQVLGNNLETAVENVKFY